MVKHLFLMRSVRQMLQEARKGVLAAPDYKAMYLELFRASEQAARLLQEAQARAEQQLLAADPPPIELAEKKES